MEDIKSNKYGEIIARRKAERESEEKPLRFKAVRTVDGGVALIRKE